MIYVALLRGINVGGKNKINMKELKNSFFSLGFANVLTYINSGNIIFETENKREKLSEMIEKVILKDFALNIGVLVKSYDEVKKVVNITPQHWTNDSQNKCDVIFMWEESALSLEPSKYDEVIEIDKTIVWKVCKKEYNKSGLSLLAKNNEYKSTTIRNINTTRKLFKLMSEVDSKNNS